MWAGRQWRASGARWLTKQGCCRTGPACPIEIHYLPGPINPAPTPATLRPRQQHCTRASNTAPAPATLHPRQQHCTRASNPPQHRQRHACEELCAPAHDSVLREQRAAGIAREGRGQYGGTGVAGPMATDDDGPGAAAVGRSREQFGETVRQHIWKVMRQHMEGSYGKGEGTAQQRLRVASHLWHAAICNGLSYTCPRPFQKLSRTQAAHHLVLGPRGKARSTAMDARQS